MWIKTVYLEGFQGEAFSKLFKIVDVLVAQNELEKAVLEFGISIRMFYDQPRQRELLVAKALKLTDELQDAPLAESIHIAQKMAQARFEGQA